VAQISPVPVTTVNLYNVWQTKRDLNYKIKEHQTAIKQQKPENSALCEHVMKTDHIISRRKSQILEIESNFSK